MPGCSLGLGMETRCGQADARAPAMSPLHQQRAGVRRQESELAGETPAADPSSRVTASLGKREEISRDLAFGKALLRPHLHFKFLNFQHFLV